MASQYSRETCLHFPENISREYFASWFSGFTDGEGHLGLYKQKYGNYYRRRCTFAINLRSDDSYILELTQSFFECGMFLPLKKCSGKGKKPQSVFYVVNLRELAEIIIPHFDKHPLLAKKIHDYSIWRQGVLLAYKVFNNKNKKAPWPEEDKVKFDSLVFMLKSQRKFKVNDGDTAAAKSP